MNRNKVVSTRMTEQEYGQLTEEAEQRGASISQILMAVWRNQRTQSLPTLESWVRLQESVEQLNRSMVQLTRFQERYADWILQVLVPQTDPEWNRLKNELQALKPLLKEGHRG